MLYQITHANAVVATYSPDTNKIQRVAGITTTGASSNNLALTPFAYDGAGDVKGIGSQTFVYDKVSRLVTGNILANGRPRPRAPGSTPSATSPPPPPPTGGRRPSRSTPRPTASSPVTYDAAGDMTSRGGTSYTWDTWARCRRSPGPGSTGPTCTPRTGSGSRSGTARPAPRRHGPGPRRQGAADLRQVGGTWSWSKDYVYRDGAAAGKRGNHGDEALPPRPPGDAAADHGGHAAA